MPHKQYGSKIKYGGPKGSSHQSGYGPKPNTKPKRKESGIRKFSNSNTKSSGI